MDHAAHVMSVSSDDHGFAVIIDTARVEDSVVIDAHGKLFLQRIVHAINERKVVSSYSQADNLRVVFDQFVVRTARVVRVRRQLMRRGEFVSRGSDGANGFRGMQTAPGPSLPASELGQNPGV